MNLGSRPKSGLGRFVYCHLPAILYAAAIIAVSSIPNLKGPTLKLVAFDKVAHLLEYAVFAWLAIRAFSNMGPRVGVNQAFFLAALFVSLFAVFDEYYQRFVPGRQFDIFDILIDVCGAMLVLIWFRARNKKVNQTTD